MGQRSRFSLLVVLILACVVGWIGYQPSWTEAELETLRSLWIGNLAAPPKDPSNAVADHPTAQRLGHQLFFDTRFSRSSDVSCATCHQPRFRFTDQRKRSEAIGTSARNAPSLVGVAHSPWLYWDGRKDSLWSQALSPLEDPAEHGGHRLQYAHLVASDPAYVALYEELYGPLADLLAELADLLAELNDPTRFPVVPKNAVWTETWSMMTQENRQIINRIFSNLGKAIAAYERLLQPSASRFDRYVQSLDGDSTANESDFTWSEQLGLRVFINNGNCIQCHNGPLLTNNFFHNIANLPHSGTTPDLGRAKGIRTLLADPFNCLGSFSDASDHCDEVLFAQTGKANIGAMRTPSLRNLTDTQPYGHAGQHKTLKHVLRQYDEAPEALIGHNEAKPLNLWPWEIFALEAFLETLAAPPATQEVWLNPPNGLARTSQP